MAIKLGLNIASLKARSQLNRSTDRLGQIFERLASGQRINSAADDPAGLAVANRLGVDARIANQGKRNVSDGLSLLRIAQAATQEIENIVQRQAELAEQAASETISEAQREALNTEYQALSDEIDRITAETTFNGISLLEGEESANARQVLMSDLAQGNFRTLDISADGRYALYYNVTDSTLEQLDLLTNEVTVIATGSIGTFAQSASGDRVVFGSGEDLTGEDPNGYTQLFVWDRTTGELDQISNSANTEFLDHDSLYGITISADGSTIAFTSATRYNSDGSVAGYVPLSGTINIVNLDTGVWTDAQVSTSSNMYYIALSADGSQLAFSSYNNLTGNNADLNEEIFSLSVSDPVGTLTQITDTAGVTGYFGIQVTNDGTVYFGSSADLVGDNATLAGQVFVYSQLTDTLSQLTHGTGAAGIVVDRLSADEEHLYFRAGSDHAGEGSNNILQAFSANLVTGEIDQLTNFSGTTSLAGTGRMSADGRFQLQVNASSQLELVDLRPDAGSVQISTGSGEQGLINTSLAAIHNAIGGLGGFLLTTQSGALGALESAKQNIENLTLVNGTLASGISRLEHAHSALSAEAQLKISARERIMNADIALEVAEMIREQVLQQAATALLAQANLQSELVLKLLQ